MKTIIILIITLIASEIGISQVCGQFIDGQFAMPLIKVSYELNSDYYVRSNENGDFELNNPLNLCESDIYFETELGLVVKITNVQLNLYEQLNLGRIYIPEFKYISLEDYEKLSSKQKKECIPDSHYTDIYGYFYSNELENKYLIKKCHETFTKLTNVKFNPSTKTISIDWNSFDNCE